MVSGYSGGTTKNPTYQQVCTGTTGHAEVMQITYDPAVITFPELLEVFWQTHDPTTKNRQGNDFGTQYRSAIFYHNDEQRRLRGGVQQKLDAAGAFRRRSSRRLRRLPSFTRPKITTKITSRNSRQAYCQAVIPPKLDKLKKVFADKLKSSPQK